MFLAAGSPMINSWIANDQQIHRFVPVRYLMSLERFFAQNIECHTTNTRMSTLKNSSRFANINKNIIFTM